MRRGQAEGATRTLLLPGDTERSPKHRLHRILGALKYSHPADLCPSHFRDIRFPSMEMTSHSCPRCEWLVLGSKTGHSPVPEENKRLEDKIQDHLAAKKGSFSDLSTDEERTDIDWDFHWPIGYKEEHGDCELLQFFITCYRNLNSFLRDSDFAVDCCLRGDLHHYDYIGERVALLGFILHPGAGSVLTEHPDGTHPKEVCLELFNPLGQ
jgi:hypothetical protein